MVSTVARYVRPQFVVPSTLTRWSQTVSNVFGFTPTSLNSSRAAEQDAGAVEGDDENVAIVATGTHRVEGNIKHIHWRKTLRFEKAEWRSA